MATRMRRDPGPARPGPPLASRRRGLRAEVEAEVQTFLLQLLATEMHFCSFLDSVCTYLRSDRRARDSPGDRAAPGSNACRFRGPGGLRARPRAPCASGGQGPGWPRARGRSIRVNHHRPARRRSESVRRLQVVTASQGAETAAAAETAAPPRLPPSPARTRMRLGGIRPWGTASSQALGRMRGVCVCVCMGGLAPIGYDTIRSWLCRT